MDGHFHRVRINYTLLLHLHFALVPCCQILKVPECVQGDRELQLPGEEVLLG